MADSNLVARLRDDLCGVGLNDVQYGLVMEAADALAEQAETIERLREELGRAGLMLAAIAGDMDDGHSFDSLRTKYLTAIVNARDDAREALRGALDPASPVSR